MLRVGSWLYGKKPGHNSSTQSLNYLSEMQDLDDAMRETTLILNDDVDGAEAGLDKGASSFHKLGKGVVAFIRATLGFEQDIMRQASDRLNEAETDSFNDQHRAIHNANAPGAYRSRIYSPGTEYALCQALAQLMGAVTGVLNESLTESIKSFYKLRKAYMILESILKMEERFYEQSIESRNGSSADQTLHSAADRDKNSSQNSSALGNYDTDASGSNSAAENNNNYNNNDDKNGNAFSPDPDSDIFGNRVDIFIHSGSNFAFGIVLLLISMVPPAFGKLLSIIRFYGDKQRGLRMLWQASKFHNLVGAIASLALLGYYNGFVRYCDIMPDVTTEVDRDVEGYPQEKLASLLAEMRKQYPQSQLWVMEESRMNGANKNLDTALHLLCNGPPSPLKQVEALRVFERSLNAMYLHEYELCSQSFLQCMDLNSWSRSLYCYIAGSCQLAQYRLNAKTDPSAAKKHAEKATELFHKTPSMAGRKRFMARQLPFDVFVARKVAKWEARAKEWGVPLVDAIGVDPVEEMIFFWNGHSRMTRDQLEESLMKLAWSESAANENWIREGPEEKAILELLRAAVLRAMRRHAESEEILQTRVLCHDRTIFKGHVKDDWVLPVAHFEMAANLWMERPAYIAVHGPAEKSRSPSASSSATTTRGNTSSIINNKNYSTETDEDLEYQKACECKKHLEKTARWESYDLDARVGLKVTAAMGAVRKWESAHSVFL